MPDVDDQADIILALPTDKLVKTLHTLDAHKRQRLESVLSYDEDTAGGLMNIDQVTIRADVSLDVVLRYLRIRGEMPDLTDQLFVTDRHDHYLGALYLGDLLTNDPEEMVKDLMRTDIDAMHAHMPDTEVAREFENDDLISAPVVDDEHKLIGRITVDDVVDVIRDEGDHSIMGMAGLSEEEDMFSPVLVTSRRRGIWLGINLLTSSRSWPPMCRSGFSRTFSTRWWRCDPDYDRAEHGRHRRLADPDHRDPRPRAGSSSRASSNYRLAGQKGSAGGLLNGVLWALVVASLSIIWFGNIGAVIAFALIVNLLAGALAGAVIPVILRQIGCRSGDRRRRGADHGWPTESLSSEHYKKSPSWAWRLAGHGPIRKEEPFIGPSKGSGIYLLHCKMC